MSNISDIPLKTALRWILFSVLLISGTLVGGLLFWHYYQQSRLSDPRYTLVAIVQSCRDKEPLQTNYLAELLGLSIDRPTNLYRFDVYSAEQKLLSCPLIKSVKIKKIKPGMLYIDYSLRKPIAYVLNFSNTAIDAEGILIPFKPFHTPKKIPELIFNLPPDLTWGDKITGDNISLAYAVIKQIEDERLVCGLKRIDISKAFSQKCGEREIVLFFEDFINSDSIAQMRTPQLYIVRFSPQNWQKQLVNYKKLWQKLSLEKKRPKPPAVIDMRISQLAFITI